MVFGERLRSDSDDLLEQRDGVAHLPVGLVGNGKHMLRRESVGVVFGDVTVRAVWSG